MSYYNPSRRLSEWAAASLSPYIKLENETDAQAGQTQSNPQAFSNLSVGLWSGNVELKDLELRPEAFETFLNGSDDESCNTSSYCGSSSVQIKWKVIQGSIDSVKVQIPWKSLLVGSAYSSFKQSAEETSQEEGKNKEEGGEEDPVQAGCTLVNIQGVKLLIGYEIIHHDPFLKALQNQNQQHNCDNSQSSLGESENVKPPDKENDLQEKIRAEKNRILQSAERRLLAGLDPFPPSLMEGLQSIMTASIQSGMQSAIAKSSTPIQQPSAKGDSGSIDDGNASLDTVSKTKDTYRSRMENYLSSTIKSLLWRVFDSLSLSVTQVQLSVRCYSHYDKDFASIKSKERVKSEGGKGAHDPTEEATKQQPQKQNARKRDYRRKRPSELIREFSSTKFRQRRSTLSTQTEEAVEGNIACNDDSSIKEDPSIWAREGQIEFGLTLDQFDLRPGPLAHEAPTGDSNDDADTAAQLGPSALKLVQLRGAGVFLQRKHDTTTLRGDGLGEGAAEGIHTGWTLDWNGMHDDDYIVAPTNIQASCKVYRNASGSLTVGLDSSSTQKEEGGSSDAHSKMSSSIITSGSKGSVTTKRRGKREKRRTLDLPGSEISVNHAGAMIKGRPGQSIMSRTAPTIATAEGPTRGDHRRNRINVTGDDLLPHRIELSLEMGHIRSTLSPRQIFLLHSLTSSMTRMKRGRPRTTIRAAQAHDKALLEQMAEEGQSMLAWEEKIYREVPALRTNRSHHSKRSLPGVVASWWKYALYSVVDEMQQRKMLLDKCRGDISSFVRRRTFLSRDEDYQRVYGWKKQSKMRKEYISLYTLANSQAGGQPSAVPADNAATAAAKLRLEQLEEELSVERILLLKNVARAASIRHAREDSALILSPADAYYCFPPNSYSKGAAEGTRTSLLPSPSSSPPPQEADDIMSRFYELEKSTVTLRKRQGSTVSEKTTISPEGGLSFSANLHLSGFSLAVCETHEKVSTKADPEYGNAVEAVGKQYPSDDISCLTGFSDDDDSKTPKQVMGDSPFDPLCHFWPATRHGLCCEPIMIIHVADIRLSAQKVTVDNLRPPHTESEFWVGGILLQAPDSQQQTLFSLGSIQSEGTMARSVSPFSASSTTDLPVRPTGISGQFGLNTANVNIGSAEISIGWSWLEVMKRFALANQDISPSKATVPLEGEDLLAEAFSNHQMKIPANRVPLTIDFDKLKLTIPVHHDGINTDKTSLFFVASATHLQAKFGNARLQEEGQGETIGASDDDFHGSNGNVLFVMEGLDAAMVIKNIDLDPVNSRSRTQLLGQPVNVQLLYSSGEGIQSIEQTDYLYKSHEVRTSPIHMLVSNSRLETLVALINTAAEALNEDGDTTQSTPLQQAPMPFLSEFVLAEMKVIIQSLSIQIVGDELISKRGQSKREQLEDIIASYLSQLSCLDYDYPSLCATKCMDKLSMNQLGCALGFSPVQARDCADAAKANFYREVAVVFGAASSNGTTKSRRNRRTRISRSFKKNNRHVSPETTESDSLAVVLDQIVEKATATTVTEFGDIVLLLPDSFQQDLNLAIDADSLSISRSNFYSGSMVQIDAKALGIRNDQAYLLNIQPNAGKDQGNLSSSTQKVTSPEDSDVAVSLLFRENAINRNIYIEAGRVETIFAPEAYLEAMEACRKSTQTALNAKRGSKKIPDDNANPNMIVNVNVSSYSVIFTDKYIPFIECQFEGIAVEQSAVESQSTRTTSVKADSICFDCLWQIGYSNFVSTHPERVEGFGTRSVFSIELTERQGPLPNELVLGLEGVQVLFLRQIINEIIQYTSSPGLRLFLRSIESEEVNDKDTHPPSPSKFNVLFGDSTVILPRGSNSIDMLCIEAEEIYISCEQVEKTWSIENYSFSSDAATPSAMAKGRIFASKSSSDIFFDCRSSVSSTQHSTPLHNETATNQPKIKRYSVQLKGAHIFTALNKGYFSAEKVHIPEIHRKVRINGHANHKKSPFIVLNRMRNSTVDIDIRSRRWERITSDPISLGVKADYAPILRLLIEDVGGVGTNGISLDMRMSQFYLLMSVWFSNMQELPLYFPYEEELIREAATNLDPPSDWPEYGTSEFVSRIKRSSIAKATFEMGLCLTHLRFKCSFDHPNYFGKIPDSMGMMLPGRKTEEGGSMSFLSVVEMLQAAKVAEEKGIKSFISITLEHAVVSIMNDKDALQRIGVGASSIELSDGRNSQESPTQSIIAKDKYTQSSYVDLNWGLDCGRHTLVDGLPLPFQASVFMTPDNHCLINLGLDMAESVIADLTPIWILLDYFGCYFKEPEYGHPAFEAEQMFEKMSNGNNVPVTAPDCDGDEECMSIDFRLWMIKPHVVIPSSSDLSQDPCVMLETDGLYYRYKSFGVNYSSQDIVAKDLGIIVLREYMEASRSRGLRQVSGSLASCGVKTLIDGLSFSLRYDYNESNNFTRFALRMPLTSHHFDRHSMDGIESSDIDAQPFSVPPPVVCKPFVAPSRTMGKHETSIYFSHQYMKLAAGVLSNFVGGSSPETDPIQDDQTITEDTNNECDNSSPQAYFSVTAHVERVRFFGCDPVMGMHRPILSICLPSLSLTASQLQEIEPSPSSKIDALTGRLTEDYSKDMQALMEATVFVDYFKLGLTRNWEPGIEPFKFLIMYEKSASRGKGITFDAGCPLHVNITSALIETMDDAVKCYELIRAESAISSNAKVPLAKRCNSDSVIEKSISADDNGHSITVLHNTAEQLDEHERFAFSLKNKTGERVRVHTHSALETDISSCKTVVAYLEHLHLMPLSFPATSTVIQNLQQVEIPIQGDQDIRPRGQKQCKTSPTSTSHEIDLQVPGFLWVRDISFDKAGKHFIELVPRSLSAQAKINNDWRLRNALHVLAEVSSVNGGRRLSVASLFEVVNKTDHPIHIAISPDPLHSPHESFGSNLDSVNESHLESSHGDSENDGFATNVINPDEIHSISYLLLESALRLKGNHLGSVWIRPDPVFSTDHKLSQPEIDHQNSTAFPSRPVQLAKILHESSVVFQNSNGNPNMANQVACGIEVSCPQFDKNNTRTSTPFCYVVEVKRSPMVRSSQVDTTQAEEASAADVLSPGRMGKGLKNAKNIFTKTNAQKALIHAPISYSLIVHAPIVIENLLPERGRFELMDALSKQVLWFGSLEAGERVPVHSVGLDAPLLLLVNLGFCRTNVGEGALIHHGGGDGLFKAGGNTIGTAMKTSKDKVKKTISTITESKDNRGAKRMGMMQTGNMKNNDATTHRKTQFGFNTENDLIESRGGVLRRGDGFGVEDIAAELSVTDGLGQRLTLLIDNVLGSGGQRRVSLYCPFWIVNTTEHSLRYKQEKALSFVAGTVLSPDKDGSKPVDGSNRNDVEDDDNLVPEKGMDSLGTVFSGRSGALSMLDELSNKLTKPSLLAALVSEDLPLGVMSKLAFMFNFQDFLSLGQQQRLCMQLTDTTKTDPRYSSAWSSGFGLESVGVTQIVGMHCKDGRGLEVSVSISIAPGRLSNYTKIIRICPRYIVVNQLACPIRLWQDSSMLHPNVAVEDSSKDKSDSQKYVFANINDLPDGVINQYELLFGSPTVIHNNEDDTGMIARTAAHDDACYIATVRPAEIVPFHLPDTRLERLLRVDLGSSWYLSPSFAADVTGENVLAMAQAMDLRMLPHVSSRGAPVFTVALPPSSDTDWSGDLGVWFETDWGRDRTLIVKGIREGSYTSLFTDVIVGDELILIDGIAVESLTFDEAMKHLKSRLAAAKEAAEKTKSQSPVRPLQLIRKKRNQKQPSFSNDVLTLTFLTLEERLRRLRRAAVSKDISSKRSLLKAKGLMEAMRQDDSANSAQDNASKDLLVDMKYLFQSVFVFLRSAPQDDPPHRITNRSLHYLVYYRQKACESHPWKNLAPGESAAYTWEEPLKPKKLSVRVGAGEYTDGELGGRNSIKSVVNERPRKNRRPLFSFQFVESESEGTFGPTKSIRLEEIGYMDKLPCPAKGGKVRGSPKDNSLHCQVDTEGATRVLIISDEMTSGHDNDETYLRWNLANIRRDISDEGRRKASLEALSRTLSLSLSCIEPPQNSPLSPIREKTSNPSQRESEGSLLPDIDVIESEVQDIGDYGEGLFITKCNQVVIEVLEATGLKSSDLNGVSNPYVKVGLICGDRTKYTGSFRSKKPTRSTYYVEKTLSPQWSHQCFIFDVPEKAATDPKETRRYSVQAVIKSTERLGTDKFLGQAYAHLRNLKDQKEHVGWYPLMGKLGQGDTGKDSLDRVCGSIRLRVQWVYDSPGLIEYHLLCSNRRLAKLCSSKDGMKRQLKSIQDAAREEMDRKDSFSVKKVPALAALYKKKRRITKSGDDTENKESTKTKEDKHIQASRAIITLATENKLLGRLNAARSKIVSRSSFKVGAEKRRKAFSIQSKPSFDDYYDNDDGSSSDSNLDDEMSACSVSSGEMLIDIGTNELISDNFINEGIPSQNTLSPLHNSNSMQQRSSYPHQHTTDAHRLFCLRWKSWDNHVNNLRPSILPFYPSWTVARVFINANSEKPDVKASPHTNATKPAATGFLRLPPSVPSLFTERETSHVCDLLRSRSSFFKAAKRSLGNVVNLGGVLTIRPMTALNLPETYTGMFVKLRFGNKICLSETVDSKVSPVWTDNDSLQAAYSNRASTTRRRSMRSYVMPRQSTNDADIQLNDIAEMVNPARAWGRPRESDLTVEVDAFETSKSLRLTVIGEKLQSKVEIGVLEIPLGPALECCAQSIEDYEEDRNKISPQGLPPAYCRWFPLMSASETVPIEGDMGKSARPQSEKLHDNEFEEYFAPCIKLALMFQPNVESDNYDAAHSSNKSTTNQYVYAKFERISAALIDSSRIMELLSFSSRDADLRISVTSAKTRISVAVGNVQLDQQSLNGKVPVVLAPTPVKLPQPTVQFLAWRDNIRSKSDMDSFDYVAVQVQEMDLKIEESWLYDIWEMYVDVTKKREARAKLHLHQDKMTKTMSKTMFEGGNSNNAAAINKASAFLRQDEKPKKKKKIYVRELILGFMKVNLSYFKSKNNWNSELPDEVNVDTFQQWSQNVTADIEEDNRASLQFLELFPSISDAPIRFHGRLLNHVYEPEGEIWRSLRSFYSAEALRQIYKIVGSLDFVGNPTMVLTSFRTGLRDFILQPSRELKHITKNPSRLGVGVLKGTLSLLSNSASGIFGFTSNLGASVSHAATMLTLDEHFQQLHSEQKAAQQKHYDRWKKKGFGHATLLVTRPAYDILFGVASAATGLLTEPYRGAKSGGAIGFTKGTAIGVIGVIAKPIVGLSDAFSHVMEGFHDIAKSANLLEGKFKPSERYRLPYCFSTSQMLLPFSQVGSRSAQLLLAHPVDKKTMAGEEVILVSEALHMGSGVEHYVVVTTLRVALFKLKVVDGQGFITVNLVWQVRFGIGARISASLGNRGHNGSILYVSRHSQKRANIDEVELSASSHHNTTPADSRMKSETGQGNYFFAEGEGRHFNPETPKSFYPLGGTAAAFRLRTAWPFTAAEGEDQVTRFAIEGSFLQRSQLCRIHNAICCLSGDFDTILHEGKYEGEGVTSFGPLLFQRPEERPELAPRNESGSSSYVYSSLERITWKCSGSQHDGIDTSNSSDLSHAPPWLLKSRSRGMLGVPETPLLPSNIDPTSDNVVSQQLLTEVDDGDQTVESATREIYSHAKALQFQKLKEGLVGNEQFLRNSRFGEDASDDGVEEEHSVNSSIPISLASSGPKNYLDEKSCEQDGFANEVSSVATFDASIEGMTPPARPSPATNEEQELTRIPSGGMLLQERLGTIDESQFSIDPLASPAMPESKTNAPEKVIGDESNFAKRLFRVENMLERLVGEDLSTGSLSHVQWPHTPTRIQNDNDQLSTVSGFTNLNTPTTQAHQQHEDKSQVEALLKEIDDLKKQLATKDEEASHVITWAPLGPEVSEPKPRKNFKSRVKKIFHGKEPE